MKQQQTRNLPPSERQISAGLRRWAEVPREGSRSSPRPAEASCPPPAPPPLPPVPSQGPLPGPSQQRRRRLPRSGRWQWRLRWQRRTRGRRRSPAQPAAPPAGAESPREPAGAHKKSVRHHIARGCLKKTQEQAFDQKPILTGPRKASDGWHCQSPPRSIDERELRRVGANCVDLVRQNLAP